MESVRRGLDFAMADYVRIAERGSCDVKPKEDQIKCGLYRALTEAGFLVHVEAAYARNGQECDVLAIAGDVETAIEIKTAWAADDWANKPTEQAQTWAKDIDKLMSLAEEPHVTSGLFVLLLAFQEGAAAEGQLRKKINSIGIAPALASAPISITAWNGLDKLQYFVFKVFG